MDRHQITWIFWSWLGYNDLVKTVWLQFSTVKLEHSLMNLKATLKFYFCIVILTGSFKHF